MNETTGPRYSLEVHMTTLYIIDNGAPATRSRIVAQTTNSESAIKIVRALNAYKGE